MNFFYIENYINGEHVGYEITIWKHYPEEIRYYAK